jgi:hypothetical protein
MGTKANDLKKAVGLVNEMTEKQLYNFSKETATNLIKKWVESEYKYWKWCNKNNPYTPYTNESISEQLNKYNLKDKESLSGILRQFANVKKALTDGKLLLTHRGGLKWDCQYIENDDIHNIGLCVKKALCSYPFSWDSSYWAMSCYGTSRPLEIILAFGYNLGLDFHNIPQNQKIN